MKDNTIKRLLGQLNGTDSKYGIFLRPVSETVDFGKVWLDKPKMADDLIVDDQPYKFYFIKNQEGVYVGAVYDMINDLHWYVLPAFRKKGILIKALTSFILPHLFLSRQEQRISIDITVTGKKNAKASSIVATKAGFIKDAEKGNGVSTFTLSATKLTTMPAFSNSFTGLSEARIESIEKELWFIARHLNIYKQKLK